MKKLVPAVSIEQCIYLIRGHKVMLDSDLAKLYEVTTRRINEQVKRNLRCFPDDFFFQLSAQETAEFMRSQNATGSKRNIRYRPYAFTEHGAVMLASILKSGRAMDASVQIVRAFIRLGNLLATHKELARKLAELEKKYDAQFRVVFDAIRELMEKPIEELHPKVQGFVH